jgi:outer membrane protein
MKASWATGLAIGVGGTLALGPLVAEALTLPRWEVGVGVAALNLPDYRGSDERRGFVSPLPYLVYRGDTFKADREGARVELFGSSDVHLDFYLGGNLPVSSSRNQARQGMPGMKGALDLGPALDIRLTEWPDEKLVVKLRLPVSYGFTLGKPGQSLGWQTSPTLNLYTRDFMGWGGWGSSLKTGPLFGSHQRHAYYYDVQEAYATADRPAYKSSGGYSGWQLGAAVNKRFERFSLGAFLRYDNLSGAAFHDSPLVKTRHYAMGGVALIWVLGESAERVKLD